MTRPEENLPTARVGIADGDAPFTEKDFLVSVVSPAFNETDNLPLMYERLERVFAQLELAWEWVVIDDHSSDATFEVLKALSIRDSRVRGFRLARRSGSHAGIACGLSFARGTCCLVMAADLQDPPECIPQLIDQWERGFQVVWAVRAQREGESAINVAMSRFYYWLMRYFVGMKEMASTGADFMLLDRTVVDAFNEFRESTVSVLALITWMGFRQTAVTYDKAARIHGRSGWAARQKLKLVVDSVTSFSYLPIRLIAYVGIVIALLGFIYAVVVIGNAFGGNPPSGWSSLMVVLLFMGGIQMLMLGVIGVYLWRAVEEARRRPRFLIEEAIEPDVTNARASAGLPRE